MDAVSGRDVAGLDPSVIHSRESLAEQLTILRLLARNPSYESLAVVGFPPRPPSGRRHPSHTRVRNWFIGAAVPNDDYALGRIVQHLADLAAKSSDLDPGRVVAGFRTGFERVDDARFRQRQRGALSANPLVLEKDRSTVADDARFRGHEGAIYTARFSPDGTELISAGADRTFRIWDIAVPHSPVATVIGHTDVVWSLAIHPDGTLLATTGDDGRTRLWDIARRDRPVHVATLAPQAHTVWSAAFRPDGLALATAGDDHRVHIWDLHDPSRPALTRTLAGHTGPVRAVVFHPGGRYLASTGRDRTVRLWDTANSTHLTTLEGQRGAIRTIAFSPDARLLAAGGDEATVQLWDTTDLHNPRPITSIQHSGIVRCVRFSPRGDLLATACAATPAVQLWRAGGQFAHVATLAHRAPIRSIDFRADGLFVATGGDEQRLRIWDLSEWT
ncbi:WD40 repeat domain-containing protein [Nocardia sp. NPDC127579]|uniref:WD40 repeat domain-containing protein n=1 Tax=Nocardia sp. NPDC127579 TaxID=3345402 RepID=UPI00363C837A